MTNKKEKNSFFHENCFFLLSMLVLPVKGPGNVPLVKHYWTLLETKVISGVVSRLILIIFSIKLGNYGDEKRIRRNLLVTRSP